MYAALKNWSKCTANMALNITLIPARLRARPLYVTLVVFVILKSDFLQKENKTFFRTYLLSITVGLSSGS